LVVTDNFGKTAETTVNMDFGDQRQAIKALQVVYQLLLSGNSQPSAN
jgi:hypothetical protein